MSRFLAEIKSVDERGAFTAIASTPRVDRSGEIIAPAAFHPLPPSIPVAHEHGGEPVARATPYYVGRELHIDGVFASTARAQDVRTLVREGVITGVSVVFLTTKSAPSDTGQRVIIEAELLACDFVSMPCQPDARVLSSRGVVLAGDTDATIAACRAMCDDALLAMAALDLAEAKAFLDELGPPTDGAGMRRWLFEMLRDI